MVVTNWPQCIQESISEIMPAFVPIDRNILASCLVGHKKKNTNRLITLKGII
jgi:mannose/fructose/N-acetylgalactosamine-specific phosphotransferase system component IID